MKFKGTGLRFWDSLTERDEAWEGVFDFAGIDVPLITSQKRLIPFQFVRDNDALTISALYVVYQDGSETQIEEDLLFAETDGTYDWILYFGQKIVEPDCFREMYLNYGRAYIRIEMSVGYYYSDWFDVCDVEECYTEILLNRHFDNWTLDDPDNWTVVEDANNQITENSCNGHKACKWDCTDAVTDASIAQTKLTIDNRYFIAVGCSNADDPHLEINGFDNSPYNIDAIGYFKWSDIASATTITIIEDPDVGNVCGMILTRVSVEDLELYCIEDYITFQFWNENDSCQMLYQTGYMGWFNFNAKLTKPESKIVEETEDNEIGEVSPIVQSQHIRYQLKVTGNESLFDDITKLRLYDYVYIVLPNTERYRVYDITVDADWIDDYVCEFEISFYIEICSVAGCEDNYTLT